MDSNVGPDFAMDIKKNKLELWTVHYINTMIATLIINISSIVLITVLPLFTVSIGGSNSEAGLLMTVFAMAALLFRPIFGKMLDNAGRRKVLILGLFLFSLSTVSLLASSNIFILFALRFIQGIGLSAFSTALGTILSDIVPAPRLTEGVGYFGISITVATAVGPALGLYLCSRFGYPVTYIVAFVISLSSIIFASLITYERKMKNGNSVNPEDINRENADRVKVSQENVNLENVNLENVEWENINREKVNRDSMNHESTDPKDTALACETADMPRNQPEKGFIEKSSLRPCIIVFFITFAVSSVFSFMPIFGIARGIGSIGLFFTVYAVSMILARLITGKAADRYGHMIIFLPSIAITFVMFLTLAFAYSLPAVLLAAVFYGVGYGTVQPFMNAIVIRLSPPERRGAANATFYAVMDLAFGIGAFVWGFVSQIAGFTAVFLGCALCIVLAALSYFLFLHRLLVKKG